eukprot:11420251-Karenia_brevis.AAC.1
MGNMWCFLRCKYQRSWLDGMTPSVWHRYSNYLLGSKVFSLKMKTGDKQEEAAVHVPWTLLLSYEVEIRRAACALVNDD